MVDAGFMETQVSWRLHDDPASASTFMPHTSCHGGVDGNKAKQSAFLTLFTAEPPGLSSFGGPLQLAPSRSDSCSGLHATTPGPLGLFIEKQEAAQSVVLSRDSCHN